MYNTEGGSVSRKKGEKRKAPEQTGFERKKVSFSLYY